MNDMQRNRRLLRRWRSAGLAVPVVFAVAAHVGVAEGPATASLGSGQHQAQAQSDADQSASPLLAPFKAALLERKRLDSGSIRVRVLIFTRGAHERDGLGVRVFSNALHRSATAQERPRCKCTGLWVVDSRTRRGRRLLRALRAEFRKTERTAFAAELRGESGGSAAGFRVTRYNRKFRPYLVTD
jgi:hypothetical protein